MAALSAPRFRGLFPIVHTPFNQAGEVDFDSLLRLVADVRDGGADGLVFPGFASEFWRLSESEIRECAGCISQSSGHALPVILNATAQATATAVRQAREFRRMGAGALMVLPPLVVPVPLPAIESHWSQVLDAAELPFIVQDSAGLTATNLDPAARARLKTAHPNFAALTGDQAPTGPAVSRYRAVSERQELSYIVGYSGVQMLDAVRRGAGALMGGCGHWPEDRRMLDALLSPDQERGYREFSRLAPLLNFEMQSLDMVIAGHKALLHDAGIIATPLSRAPCRTMDEIHAAELRLHGSALRETGRP